MYLATDEVQHAMSSRDPVDVVGLVSGAVVHPHHHVPLGVAFRIDAYQKIKFSISYMSAATLLGPNLVFLG